MSSYYSTLVFLTILISTTHAQNGITLPIRVDKESRQFYTTFQMGSNRTTINADIDLGGRNLWFNCDDYTSNTYAPIPCNTTKCALARSGGCSSCTGPTRPGCTVNTCSGEFFSNPNSEYIVSETYYEDTLSSSKDNVRLPQLMFACVPSYDAVGLARGATGIMGLGMNVISIHKQVSDKLNVPNKFSVCFPFSGIGKLTIGHGISGKPDISKLLKSTHIIKNPFSTVRPYTAGEPSGEYFIGVKSIRVGGQTLPVNASYFSIDKNGVGGTKLDTTITYAYLHTSIHDILIPAFDKAAADMKIKRVAAQPPFAACYSSDSITRTPAGPNVPVIDLVLPGNDVYWRISGANAVVEVDRKTTCLAMFEFGPRAMTSIRIGGHQLAEHLLEFDLDSSELKFSSSLLVHNRRCSRI